MIRVFLIVNRFFTVNCQVIVEIRGAHFYFPFENKAPAMLHVTDVGYPGKNPSILDFFYTQILCDNIFPVSSDTTSYFIFDNLSSFQLLRRGQKHGTNL